MPPPNQAAIARNSSPEPSVSAFRLNPCSKSTIQMKVAVMKARVQRTLERRRMREFIHSMKKRWESSSTELRGRKNLHSFSNSSRRLFRHTTTVLPSCVSTPRVSGTSPNSAATAITITLPREMIRFC